jgi:hypothetical protein
MRTYTLNQQQVIEMFSNKTGVWDLITHHLLQENLAAVTNDFAYRNARGEHIGPLPLLRDIRRITATDLYPVMLESPYTNDESVAGFHIKEPVLGVSVEIPVYLCELDRIEPGCRIDFDNYSFHKWTNYVWVLYVTN